MLEQYEKKSKLNKNKNKNISKLSLRQNNV